MQLRANLARSWRFNFRTTCPEVPDIQLSDNLSESPRLSTSAQHGRKLQRVFESRINSCSTWSQVSFYRSNFWSWWPEVLSENCVQVGHNFTSDQVGPKLWYKINLLPCWSQVEKAGSKSVAKLTILFTSSHHGTKCVRMLYATITSSQLGTKFALCIIFNRNFVASCNKVSDLLCQTWA